MRKIVSCRGENKMESFKTSHSNIAMHSSERRGHLKKPKRFRSAFTTEQTIYLEEAFKRFPYIDREGRQHLASVLKIGERPIKIWFQNRRMKEKKEGQNQKESDDEIICNGQFDQHHFNNVASLSSTNETRSNSLSMLSFNDDTTLQTHNMEVNNIDFNKNKLLTKIEIPNNTLSVEEKKMMPTKANFYKEIKIIDDELPSELSPSLEQMKEPNAIYQSQIKTKTSVLENDNMKWAEMSINLCKKYKERPDSTSSISNIANEDQNSATEQKVAPKKEPNNNDYKEPPNKKIKLINLPPSPKTHSQVNINKPVYFPVMPGVYPSPFVASDGVLWKPVNYMPVMGNNGPPVSLNGPPLNMNGPSMSMSGTPMTFNGSPLTIGTQAPPIQETNKGCNCNCHANYRHLPFSFPTSLQNPYTQYVITVPISHTSPHF